MTNGEIKAPREYEDWLDKSNELQKSMRELSLKLRDVSVRGDNLKTIQIQLKKLGEEFLKFDCEFLAWAEKAENLIYRFPQFIPEQLIDRPVAYYYGFFVMHRTATLASQRVQITDGLNLKNSEYQWWVAYNKSVSARKWSQWGLWIAVVGTAIALLAYFGVNPFAN